MANIESAVSEGLNNDEKLPESTKCPPPPISPSESESGISSLCSDDFKKRSISPEDGDGQRVSENENKSDQQTEKPDVIYEPKKLMYQNRDLLDLSHLRNSKNFIQFSVLPQNNLPMFFQNRAQYWRLNSNEPYQDIIDTCTRCKFQSPFPQHYIRDPSIQQNELTKGVLKFLKDYEQTTQLSASTNATVNVNQPIGYQNHHHHIQQRYFPNNYSNNAPRYNPQANLLSLMNNEATTNALLNSLSASMMM